MKYNPYEVIINLLRLALSLNRHFTSDHKTIHSFFYKMKMRRKFKIFFEGLQFEERLTYRTSEELDEILRLLKYAGVIGVLNPARKCYQINYPPDMEITSSLKELLNSDKEGSEDRFNDLAKKFAEELQVE